MVIYTVIHLLLDTDITPKTLGYMLLVLLFPAVGIVIYCALGIYFRHLISKYCVAKVEEVLDKVICRYGFKTAETLPDQATQAWKSLK
jgi:hypothetical protein